MVGVKVTCDEQLAPGNNVALGRVRQVLVGTIVKSFWFTPSRSMLVNTMFTPLSLVKVFVLAALVTPSRVVGNVWVRGVNMMGMLPVPVICHPMTLPSAEVRSS